MNDTTSNVFKHGEEATDKAKRGIDQTASMLSSGAEPAPKSAMPRLDQVGDATAKVRDTAGDVSDSLISYTQDNPVKALLFSAAAGALLVTLIKAVAPSRD